jgi:hypothetical protein
MPFDAIRVAVSSRLPSLAPEALRQMLRLLRNDQYLVRDETGAYHFYLELIRRWWRFSRDL